jgi:hypothetical protein
MAYPSRRIRWSASAPTPPAPPPSACRGRRKLSDRDQPRGLLAAASKDRDGKTLHGCTLLVLTRREPEVLPAHLIQLDVSGLELRHQGEERADFRGAVRHGALRSPSGRSPFRRSRCWGSRSASTWPRWTRTAARGDQRRGCVSSGAARWRVGTVGIRRVSGSSGCVALTAAWVSDTRQPFSFQEAACPVIAGATCHCGEARVSVLLWAGSRAGRGPRVGRIGMVAGS